MAEKGKKIPQKWRESHKGSKAVQVAFDADEDVREAIRKEAYNNNVSLSDQIRTIVKLPVTKPAKRPRLTASFSDEDFEILAKRYGLNPEQRSEIRQKVNEELRTFADKNK